MSGMVVIPDGEYVKAIRRAKYLTQREIAEIAGSSDTQLWRIEKSHPTTMDVLRQFAKALGVDDVISLIKKDESPEIN